MSLNNDLFHAMKITVSTQLNIWSLGAQDCWSKRLFMRISCSIGANVFRSILPSHRPLVIAITILIGFILHTLLISAVTGCECLQNLIIHLINVRLIQVDIASLCTVVTNSDGKTSDFVFQILHMIH